MRSASINQMSTSGGGREGNKNQNQKQETEHPGGFGVGDFSVPVQVLAVRLEPSPGINCSLCAMIGIKWHAKLKSYFF